MSYFELNEEDLKSNQRGFISVRQRDWLNSIARGMKLSSRRTPWIGIGFLLFGLCIILGMFLSNESSRRALFSSTTNFVMLFLTVVAVLILIGLGVWFTTRMADRLVNAQLLTTEGKIRLDEEFSPNAGFTSYYVFVGKKKFAFSEDMSHTFLEGEKYKVFYCKSGPLELFLSFERLSSA